MCEFLSGDQCRVFKVDTCPFDGCYVWCRGLMLPPTPLDDYINQNKIKGR